MDEATVKQSKGLSRLLKTEIALFFSVLDALLIGTCVLLVLSWLLNPVYITLPGLPGQSAVEQPDPLAIHFTWPIMLAAAGLLLLRVGFRFLSNKLFFTTPGPLDIPPLRHLSYLLVTGFACILLLEFVLVKTDFKKDLPSYQALADDGDPLDFGGYIKPDPLLIWSFKPNEPYTADRTINAAGYLGDLPSPTKPENTKRIFCMGGSTTSLPSPGYPELLEERLNNLSILATTWEVYNMAVDRYSLCQGLAQFEQQLLSNPTNNPDIITLYFGWDDHWRGAVPDSLRMKKPVPADRASLLNRMRQRRIVELVTFNRNMDRIIARDDNPDGLRVSQTEYAWALTHLVRAITAAGIRPLVITAPRGEFNSDLAIDGLAESADRARTLHDAYNRIAREVCDAERVRLIDMVKWIEEDAPTRFMKENMEPTSLLEDDSIQLTETGHRFLAELIVENIRQ
jgi:lysophospholipase L1-like esterase